MNNVPTPTSPADPHRASHDRREEDADGPAPSPGPAPDQDHDGSTTAAQNPSLSPAAKEGLTKKLQFVVHLSISLDSLVYAELCALYYMDCSFFRLVIRWIAQSLFISPKADDTILIIPNYHVSAIVGPNLICVLLHLLTSLPHAGEASRGYLHGGILFDFIGQKAPSSKLTLVLLDLVVFGLQSLMLAVNMERDRIRKVVNPVRQIDGAEDTTVAAATTQDYDAEERGVLRDAPVTDGTGDIEMQPLGRTHDNGDLPDTERAGLLGQPAGPARDLEGLADTLRSGNALLASFHIRQTLRTAWNTRTNTPESTAAYAIQNVGYNATLAALAAQRRARLAAAQPR
ncbi:DUF1746-domain-containing protein [Durotheca rogersii]|uniref:DUF1746-domain-containing protein n=1 Tax=Durotheca rogersii TaxID=419775 RepID=UPI00222075AD|nr:DUF1746-domain-containing protein [Durotheca rogersii]KAI5866866.1 DUF1746-domain-containing protein [Durotheca rogersii]